MDTSYHIHAQTCAHELLNDLVTSVHDDQKDLMTDEIILVPTAAMTRALRYQITKRHGVFAGISLMTIDQYANKLRMDLARHKLAAQTDSNCTSAPVADPWSLSNLTWEILEALHNPQFIEHACVNSCCIDSDDLKHSCSLAHWLGLDFESRHPKTLYEHGVTAALESLSHQPNYLCQIIVQVGVEQLLKQIPTGTQHLFEHDKKGTLFSATLELSYAKLTQILSEILQVSLNAAMYNLSVTDGIHATDPEEYAREIAQKLTPLLADTIHTRLPQRLALANQLQPALACDVAKKNLDYTLPAQEEILRITHQRILNACAKIHDDAHALQDRIMRVLVHDRELHIHNDQQNIQVDLRMRRSRRLVWAQQTAKRFVRYMTDAPHLITAWSNGKNCCVGSDTLELIDDMPAYFTWQPLLWRTICQQIATRDKGFQPVNPVAFASQTDVNQLRNVCSPRVHIYGYTVFNQLESLFIHKLSAISNVHIYTLIHAAAAESEHISCRIPIPTAWDKQRTLLNEWLTQGMQDKQPFHEWYLASHQMTTSNDQVTTTCTAPIFHACMGEQRQIDVAQNILAGWLSDGNTSVTLDDIALITPDDTGYLQLLTAAFNHHDEHLDNQHPAQQLPLWSFKHGAQQTPEPYQYVQGVLRIAQGRAQRSDLLDLLHLSCVQQMLQLSLEDVLALEEMIEAAQISWGWHGLAKQRAIIDSNDLHSWIQGLHRLALGFAQGIFDASSHTAERAIVGGQTTQISMVSKLIEFIETIHSWCEKVAPHNNVYATDHSPQYWAEQISALIAPCITEKSSDSFALHNLEQLCTLLRKKAYRYPSLTLTIEDVIHLINQVCADTGISQMKPGALSLWEPESLAYIPYSHLIVLGITPQNFPQQPKLDGDQILDWKLSSTHALESRSKQPVETNTSQSSLQRMALMLSQAHEVHIIYNGKDTLTGEQLPLPAALQELWDADVTQSIYRYEHPLMNFLQETEVYARNTRSATPDAPPYHYHVYDPQAPHNYQAFSAQDTSVAPSVTHYYQDLSFVAPSPQSAITITPHELCSYLAKPIPSFCQRTLHVRDVSYEVTNPNHLPVNVELKPWESTQLLTALVSRIYHQNTPFTSDEMLQWMNEMSSEGKLPSMHITRPALNELCHAAQRMAERLKHSGITWTETPTITEVSIDLTHAHIFGSLDHLLGNVVAHVSSSTKKQIDAHNLYKLAVTNLLLQTQQQASRKVYNVFNDSTKTSLYQPCFILPLALCNAEAARVWIDRLTRIYHIGLQMPLPLIHEYAHRYVAGLIGGTDARSMLNQIIETAGTDGVNPYEIFYHRLLWEETPFEDFFTMQPHKDALAWIFASQEQQTYRQYLEDTYHPQTFFEYLALCIWEPLLLSSIDPQEGGVA